METSSKLNMYNEYPVPLEGLHSQARVVCSGQYSPAAVPRIEAAYNLIHTNFKRLTGLTIEEASSKSGGKIGDFKRLDRILARLYSRLFAGCKYEEVSVDLERNTPGREAVSKLNMLIEAVGFQEAERYYWEHCAPSK